MTRHPRTLIVPAILAMGLVLTGCQSEAQGDAIAAEPASTTVATAQTGLSPAQEKGPQVIGYGEPVDIQQFLVPGQITVFDFMSEYCGPCRVFAPYLERLHAERDDMTVVKVDINRPGLRGIDFRSPLARQYRIRSVPSFKVYDPQGALMAEGRDAQLMVISWIEELPQISNQ